MKQIWFAFKYTLYVFWTLILNSYYYFRFYYKACRKHFNIDYINNIHKDGFEISFNDDFDKPEIDWNLWNKWYSDGSSAESNSFSVPQIDCLIIENSILKMKVEKNTNTNYTQLYKCGSLYTSGNYTQGYGYYEIRCKVPPKGKVFWPCFWLWGGMWPPEIDIFEFMNKDDAKSNHSKNISMTTHWGYEGKIHESNYFGSQLGRTLGRFLGISVNWDEHFHTYAVDWTPEFIDFYIDDIKVFRTIYFIPSNLMSVTAGISANEEFKPSESDLPGEFLIDYIRTYKKI